MKLIKIKKGRHYSNEFRPKFFFKYPYSVRKKIMFTNSCKYVLNKQDQFDVNKLFGIGLSLRHHQNSIRVGWRYSPTLDKIILSAYDYNFGDRSNFQLERLVNIGEIVDIELRLNKGINSYSIYVNEKKECTIQYAFPFKYNIKTKLGFYFGGNNKAPHDIEIIQF